MRAHPDREDARGEAQVALVEDDLGMRILARVRRVHPDHGIGNRLVLERRGAEDLDFGRTSAEEHEREEPDPHISHGRPWRGGLESKRTTATAQARCRRVHLCAPRGLLRCGAEA